LAKLPAKPPQSLLVSLADKTHNAEAILFDYRVMGDSLWDRFNGGAAGTRWYQRALPFFKAGAAHLAEGANDITEMVRGLIQNLNKAGNVGRGGP
jgi:GTP pyrophosphokinase